MQLTKGKTMYPISVGKPYRQGVTSLLEGAHYTFDRSGHRLLLAIDSPTDAEMRSIQSGNKKQFAFAVEKSVIFFLARFGEQKWVDAPYSIHLVPEHNRIPAAAIADHSNALLTTTLVDARTGIVRGINGCTLSPDFARRLHRAIQQQAEGDWRGPAAHDAAITEVYRCFTTKQMLGRALAKMVIRGPI